VTPRYCFLVKRRPSMPVRWRHSARGSLRPSAVLHPSKGAVKPGCSRSSNRGASSRSWTTSAPSCRAAADTAPHRRPSKRIGAPIATAASVTERSSGSAEPRDPLVAIALVVRKRAARRNRSLALTCAGRCSVPRPGAPAGEWAVDPPNSKTCPALSKALSLRSLPKNLGFVHTDRG
jgi:hypothetical protein